jgi:diadenosine tetraphosphatase ApaH/serine/threonine PP2A family protein phosphatase
MRALILSDIHGNLESLTAVLYAAGEWDALWNLGDIVGYGASPNQVVELVRPLATLTVRGNHDRVCCGLTSVRNFNPTARASAKWTMEALSAENLEWLRGLPQGPLEPARTTTDEARVALAHGSPLNEDQYIQNMRDAWTPLQQMTAAIAFVGHTHIQCGFAQKEHDWHEVRPRYQSRQGSETWTLPIVPGVRHLINPGAVGQPRDFDWRAAFAIYDSEARAVVYHRVPYDVAKAQGRVRMARLPERLAERLREGR